MIIQHEVYLEILKRNNIATNNLPLMDLIRLQEQYVYQKRINNGKVTMEVITLTQPSLLEVKQNYHNEVEV